MQQMPEMDIMTTMREKVEEIEKTQQEILHKLNHLMRAVDEVRREIKNCTSDS